MDLSQLSSSIFLKLRGFQRLFFLIEFLVVRGEAASAKREAPREKNCIIVSGALSNRKHGFFYPRYFDNGPLESGYFKA